MTDKIISYIIHTHITAVAGLSTNLLPNNNPGSHPEDTILNNVLNFTYLSIGIVSTIMIIMAGITYIMSGGDPEKAKKAKNTITYSIIGIIFAVAAFSLTSLVIGAF